MFSKIIFVLATVCVINGSVINFKVYTDDPETEVASNPKDCNFEACDQLCRSTNYISGACVNGRCKCAKTLTAEEKVPEESLSSLEDNKVLQQDDNDIEAETKKSHCNNQECDQLCRRMNFTGGDCVNGGCQCHNFLNAEVTVFDESLSNLEESVLPKDCRSDKCNELCIKLNLISGACSDGCCVCNKRLTHQDTMTDSADTLSLHYCNSMECDDQCRRSGWHGGVCINGQCRCDYFSNSEDEVSEESLPVSELSEDPTKRHCDLRVCHQFCRSLKLPGGVCVNDRCNCKHSVGTEMDPVEEYLKFATKRVCRLTKCNSTCTRRGYEGGTCVKGRCKCYNTTKTSLRVSELSEDPNERSCNTQACDQFCRRLNFHGGACINGRCQCHNFLGIEVGAVDKNSELTTRRGCNLRQCQHYCARRGYLGAKCVNGRCKCSYEDLQREDRSLPSDVTSDEHEESNEELSKAAELRVPAPSVCNVVSCSTCTVFCLAVSGP